MIFMYRYNGHTYDKYHFHIIEYNFLTGHETQNNFYIFPMGHIKLHGKGEWPVQSHL